MAEWGYGRVVSEKEWSVRHPVRHTNAQNEHASVETCTVMNLLGYGPDLRKKRSDCYRVCDRLMTARAGDMATWITTGSTAEGLAHFLESSRDSIVIIQHVVSMEDGIDVSTFPGDTAVLRLNTRICSPGHCRLLLEKHGMKIPTVLYNALCDDGSGRAVLSSDLLVNEYSIHAPGQISHEHSGPSMPFSYRRAHGMNPIVALRCHCPSILQRWAARFRHWPPPDIVQKVLSLGAFVIPIGFKGSEYKHVEWRICFATGETELVSNLNDTQIQVYVMLKMILKDILKPRNKEVTPYVLKTVVLWLAENNPQTLFDKRSLFHWLHEALGILRTAITTRQLPYYMIPERNLMAACGLEGEQQRTWVETITDMINEGPRVILRLETIRRAIISYPEPLLWYSKMRTELDILMLEYMNRRLQCSDENGVTNESDVMLQGITRRTNEIVREVRQRMDNEGNYVNDLDDILFRMLNGSGFV